jgi:hypothetical protein
MRCGVVLQNRMIIHTKGKEFEKHAENLNGIQLSPSFAGARPPSECGHYDKAKELLMSIIKIHR